MPKLRMRYGFTLIELLIVIVIIGILAAAVIVVIDPASQQQKSKEAVVRANVEKGCLALSACFVTSIDDARKCNTKDEVGIRGIDGNPPGSRYIITYQWQGTTEAILEGGATTQSISYKGFVGNCEIWCFQPFNNTSYTGLQYNSTIDDAGYRWANPLWIKDTCLVQ